MKILNKKDFFFFFFWGKDPSNLFAKGMNIEVPKTVFANPCFTYGNWSKENFK
jgi:hypothetical protein